MLACALAVIGVLGAVVADVLGGDRSVRHDSTPVLVICVVAQVVASLTVVLRRRRPATAAVTVLLTAIGIFLVKLITMDSLWLAHGSAWMFRWAGQPYRFVDLWLPPALVVVAETVARYADRRRGSVVWVLIGVLAILLTQPWQPSFASTLPGVLQFIAAPMVLGLYIATRGRLVRALTERAERAEREQSLLAAQARADERARLAAELHDVLTHRVSLMVLQAGALRVSTTDQSTRTTAEDLRATGCQALEELRDLLAVLRTQPVDHPVPVLDHDDAPVPDLAALIAEAESAGMSVAFRQDGDPSRLAPVVARTAYRVVQEAITNSRKHAPGGVIEVVVRHQGDQVRLAIHNTAPPPGAAADPDLVDAGSGTGLLGLRERVNLVRGTLCAGPTSDGGFRVDAQLPVCPPSMEGRE